MREELPTLIGGIQSEAGPKLPNEPERAAFFFGRAEELEGLRSILSAVRMRGECHSVVVRGGEGIGKTRFLDEFVRWASLLEEPPVRVFRATASADAPLWSCFTTILRSRFGVDDAESTEDAKSRVRAVVSEVLGDRKVGDVLYLLGDMLELEFQGSPLTKAIDSVGAENDLLIRAVLCGFLEADARTGPLCLVFDDLHHLHDRALSMLQFLVHNVDAPILFLSSTRLDGVVAHVDWANDEKSAVVHLPLLGDIDSSALIGSLLFPGGISPMYLVEQTREVTGGHPGRIEEVTRFYRDRGTLPPPSLQEEPSIDALFEKLSAPDRLILQKAALMGGVFWLGGLIVLHRAEADIPPKWYNEADPARPELEATLLRLAEQNYLLRLPDSTFAEDEEFVFKSRALRERLLVLNRPQEARRFHRMLASWLEGKPETKSHEEYLELLAEQREKSGAESLAAEAYFAAAERARHHRSTRRELACYEKALALLGNDAQGRRLDAMLRTGELFELLQQQGAALACLRDAQALAFRLDRRASAIEAQEAIDRLTQKLTEASRL